MTFQFRKQNFFKVGMTVGREWGTLRTTVGILIYVGFRSIRVWFGEDPWKLEPSPLTDEELREAEE